MLAVYADYCRSVVLRRCASGQYANARPHHRERFGEMESVEERSTPNYCQYMYLLCNMCCVRFMERLPLCTVLQVVDRSQVLHMLFSPHGLHVAAGWVSVIVAREPGGLERREVLTRIHHALGLHVRG